MLILPFLCSVVLHIGLENQYEYLDKYCSENILFMRRIFYLHVPKTKYLQLIIKAS